MATNLAIDDQLLSEALRVGGRRTKRDTVNEALAEYVPRRKRRNFVILLDTRVISALPGGAERRVLAAALESFPIVLATGGDHLKAADLVSAA